MRYWFLWLMTGVLLAHGGLARADEDPLARPTNAQARAHLERGEALYELQKWDEAIAELEKGALIEPDLPMWLLSLGQAHRQAGHYERARWHYERFLSRIDGMPNTEEIAATVRGLIDDMKAAESRPPVDLAPATAQPPVTDVTADVTTKATQSSVQPTRWTLSRKVALGVGAGGLVAAGVGVVLSRRAQGLRDDAEALCPTISCADAMDANEMVESADASERSAVIAYGVGGAAIVGAVVLWFIVAPDDADDRVVSVRPSLYPSFAGINVSSRF